MKNIFRPIVLTWKVIGMVTITSCSNRWEFYTENTDTMFSHAQHNYHHFDGYDIYETIDYP